MALLDDHPELDLYDNDWLIHTARRSGPRPDRSDRTGPPQSLISHGCA